MRSSSLPSAELPLDGELLQRFLEASRRARIASLVNGAQSEAELAELAVTELCEAYDAEIAIVLAAPAGSSTPRVLGSAGVAGGDRRALLGRLLPAALLARVPHVQLGQDLLGLGIRSLVSVPFTVGPDDERGAIVLACLDDRHFDDADVGLLEGVADGVGRALARIRHAVALERDVALLRAVFENAPVPMLVVTAGLEVADVNAAACDLLGWRREKALGTRLADVSPYRAGKGLDEPWRSALRAGPDARTPAELLHADGSRLAVDVSATADVVSGSHLVVVRQPDDRRERKPFRSV
jgi:PAS domain S-box-containing protein